MVIPSRFVFVASSSWYVLFGCLENSLNEKFHFVSKGLVLEGHRFAALVERSCKVNPFDSFEVPAQFVGHFGKSCLFLQLNYDGFVVTASELLVHCTLGDSGNVLCCQIGSVGGSSGSGIVRGRVIRFINEDQVVVKHPAFKFFVFAV